MALESAKGKLGKNFTIGSHHYRAFVGPAEVYDLVGATQFNLLTFLGLREDHFLLDIGCGSLRGGRLFIPYLLPGRYFGIEPDQWLIDQGIENELGQDLIDIKRPVFSNDDSFTLSAFDRQFDFILAQSILSHAPQSQIKRCLAEAKKVLKPTAAFVATFIRGAYNYTGSEWLYPNCVTYTLEHMVDLAREQGLICSPIDWPHPNGQTWISIVHPQTEQMNPDARPYPHTSIFYQDELDHSTAILVKRGPWRALIGNPAKLLNATGQLIWTLCDGTRTRQDILQVLKTHFDEVEEDVLAQDLDEFIDDLITQGFLQIHSDVSTVPPVKV